MNSSNDKRHLINLFESGLQKEKDAEINAGKLMKIFKDNGINLELSTQVHDDEIKHQKIVRNIIELISRQS